MGIYCPVNVRLILSDLRDPIFQFRHCAAEFISRCLDAIGRRRPHVRATKDSLNHQIGEITSARL